MCARPLDADFVQRIRAALEALTLPFTKRTALPGARGLCLGLSNGDSGPYVRKHSKEELHVIKTLADNESLSQDLPEGFTSVQVNLDPDQVRGHRDKNNEGISAIFAVGDFSGGEFITEDSKINILNAVFTFDGRKWHAALKYKVKRNGHRYSVVLFRHSSVHHCDPSLLEELRRIGMPFERKLAAPPIGSPSLPSTSRPHAGDTMNVLYLFAGAARKASIQNCVQILCEEVSLNLDFREIDWLQNPAHNILADDLWEDLLEEASNGKSPGPTT